MKLSEKILALVEGSRELKDLINSAKDTFYDSLDFYEFEQSVSYKKDNVDGQTVMIPISFKLFAKEMDLIDVLLEIAKEDDIPIDRKEIENNVVKIFGSFKGMKVRDIDLIDNRDNALNVDAMVRKVNKKGNDIVFELDVINYMYQ